MLTLKSRSALGSVAVSRLSDGQAKHEVNAPWANLRIGRIWGGLARAALRESLQIRVFSHQGCQMFQNCFLHGGPIMVSLTAKRC